MENHPAVAARAAIIPAMTGKPTDAERRAGVAERGATVASRPDGSSSIEPWLALLRALLCRDGVDQMRADAELAVKTMAAGSLWRAASFLLLGTAHLMAGDPDQADAVFEDQVAEPGARGERSASASRSANGRCWRSPGANGNAAADCDTCHMA